jgi:hypothetical protein
MTAREAYLQGLFAALSADPGLQALGVRFGRSIWHAVRRAEGPTLVVSRGRDVPVDTNIGRTTRKLVLMVSAVVWSSTPDNESDRIFELSHPVVMRFGTDGIAGVEEGPTGEPQTGDEDGGIGIYTMQYAVTYQTATDAL